MSFEFQSTLVNVTPNFRISGAQIGGVRILYNGDIKVARLVVTNDRDIQFALSGPYEVGDPDGIYAALSGDLYELTPGILVNEGAISSVEITSEQIIVDLEGSDLKYAFELDATATGPVEVNSHTYKLPTASFAALTTAASTWRSSMDGTLEGLATSVTNEAAARIAADAAIQADVDQNEADADAAIAAEATTRETNDNTIIASVANEATTRAAADTALDGRVTVLEADPTTATAVAAVQADVNQNETDSDAADAALSARLDVLEADPTTATAVAAVQSDVDQNEADADAALAGEATTRGNADAALSGRLDVLEADPTTATAVAAVQADVDQNETDSDAADAALSGRLDTLEADPTTATAVAAVQADVDQNEADADAADAALSGRLDTLEADPTTATAVAAVQADVDQNETDSDAADAALSARLDTLEADPTTATAVAAVQADVDQNEADADAALALKAPLADPDFTGQLEVDVNLRLEYDSNLTKIHNVLRGTSIEIGNNIQMKPAAAGGRVEVAGAFQIDITEVPEYSNDTQAAAGGIIVGGLYRSGSVLHIRVS